MKIGIIGAGNMGKKHARVLSELDSVISLAISDINVKEGKALAKKHRAAFYKDFQEMIKAESPDAVIICAPTSVHFLIGKWCLQNKVKTFIEKPIASSVKEGEALIQLAKKNNTLLVIGHIERFNPAIKKVKEIIDKGELGKIIAIVARRIGGFPPQISDVNIAVDLAIHDIDICNYLLNEVPAHALINTQRNHIKKREDSVEFFLKYSRASAYIQANWISPVKIRVLTITGTEGYLEMNYVSQKIEFYKSRYTKFRKRIGDFSDFVLRFSNPDKIIVPVNEKEPLKEELISFLQLVKKGKYVDSSYAVEALKIATMVNK